MFNGWREMMTKVITLIRNDGHEYTVDYSMSTADVINSMIDKAVH